MSPPVESSLLRLAIAEGLIRWEDLDAVAEHLPAEGGTAEVSPLHGRWVAALIGAGLLTEGDVARLDAELRSERVDLTPDLAGSARSWPAPPTAFERAAAASAPPPSALPPELRFLADWPRYRVDRLLGSGGMGTVFKAFDPTLGRWVALKFLHRNDERQTERFLREARSQARVSHPNVCQVHEVGEAEGRPYIAMQFIDGRSLGELCDELTRDEQVRLVRDVARAVHAAHRTGLVHRDLKPGNILLARDYGGDTAGEIGGETRGEIHPYVVDFGLAMTQDEVSLSRTGMISGTPAYISPEAAQGHPLDRRTDIYSLGVVLYELLAGTPPFAGANLARVLVQLVQEDPKPLRLMAPATPEDLETIVAKCLEKDPNRRYETARDLAEDLDRFLDGEPIRARPTGWTYRAGKRLRKNKALAIVSAAAVLALLLIGLWSLRAQWQARERAELAQRFGQRIGSFRTSMEYVATQPLHDITPYKRQLREEMDSIRAEMKRIGPVAEGPGNFALGQGYLALHQDDAAREHLRRAWEADERGPEVAEALGLAFGRAYERALADADRSPAAEGPSLRAEAESLDRRPAVRYLREALASAPGSSHLTGLIALYEGRYAEALADARRDTASPQAARLEAKVFAAQANEAARAGRYAEALRLFDRSGETYAALAASRPSDPDLYADDCARRGRRLQAAIALADVPEAEVKADLAACDRALQVDPGLAEGLVVESDLLSRLGEQKLKRGTDPTGDLSAGIRLAESAIALDPRDVDARNHLAMSHRLLAQWRLGHGADARADIRQGIAAARGAVEIQPEMPSGYDHLGTAYIVLAQDQQRRGADPRQAVAQAVASYQKAAGLNPKSLPAFIGLGNAWKVMSEVEVAQGLDPSVSTGKGVAALERAAALNPSWATIHNNLGNAHLTLGESLLTRGLDPRAALDRAAMSYRRAIELKPDYYLARFNLAYTWRTLGEALIDQGQDPKPALDQAGAALDEAARLNATDADVFLERARVKLLAARWRQRQRRDAAPELTAAAAELTRAETLNPQQPDVFFTEGLIARYRAETARDNAARAAALGAGLERVGKALAINAGEARYLALRGLFESMAARLEKDPTRRASQARQAVASLEAAFRINPFLQREYGPALAEARLDAGGLQPRPAQL